MNKAKVVALVALLVGVLCHVGGVTYSDADQDQVLHGVGLVFDAVAGISAMVGRKGTTGPGGGAVPLILLALVATGGQGCIYAGGANQPPEPTPEQKIDAVRRTLNAAETALLMARVSGAISPRLHQELTHEGGPVHAAYQSLIDAYERKGTVSFDDAHAAVNAALRAYVERLEDSGVDVDEEASDERAGDPAARAGGDGVRRGAGEAPAGASAAHDAGDRAVAAGAPDPALGQPHPRRRLRWRHAFPAAERRAVRLAA